MSKMSLFKKLLVGIAVLASLTIAAVPAISASEPRDYNSNSIVYGGAYSVSELRGLLNTGVNRNNCRSNYSCPYQYAQDLELLYGRLGMGSQYWDNLSNGTVFKDGHVEVNGKTVATNVQTMGRHDLPGSTREPLITYTNVYWRSPSVSFNSNSIPAFVYLNYDGTMAFAIIKSCGNPVKGVGVKAIPTYNLTIRKFEDRNQNKAKEADEPFLAGWKFTVSGNGVNQTVTTGSDGSVTLKGLRDGIYSVKEITVPGWNCTTGVDRGAWINGKSGEVWFGNYKIPEPPKPEIRYTINARKFEDINSNGRKEDNEPWLRNWNIRLNGNHVDRSNLTNENGEVSFTNLPAGTYRIEEEMQDGWSNITPLSQSVTVPTANGGVPVVLFGNHRRTIIVRSNHSIIGKKFEDVNGNGNHEDDEPWLENWSIRLTGNNITREFLTDEDGEVVFTDLPDGTYTVSEVMQNGWKNITPISQNITINQQTSVSPVAIFGNQKVKTVTPSGEIIITQAKGLVEAGPADAVAGVFGVLGLGGSGAYYFKGKKALLSALKKF